MTTINQRAGLTAGLLALATATAYADTPRLVLQITVDQLRGDMPERIREHWSQDGFKYLFDHGVFYANAHHSHAVTETIVGHTTLATGAYPAEHGMVGNVWFDHELDRLVYNIEDAEYRLLSSRKAVDTVEIDNTVRFAGSDGRSPVAIQVSTFADELWVASDGAAKVFAVSVKDRGAVPLAGHNGKAFWFSKASGGFVTSSYYYEHLPGWVDEWNAQDKPLDYANKSWALLLDRSEYEFADADDRDWEVDIAGFGRVFPHPFGPATGDYFTTLLTLSPAGDELTLDFAMTLLDAEGLGEDDVTDFLAVSFSSTDYIGHAFSPSSLETEDNLIRLDRTIAELLRHVDRRVGLDNTLVVLSADHGAPEAPGYLQSRGVQAGFIDVSGWPSQQLVERMIARFGVGADVILSFFPPYVYLDYRVIAENELDQSEVEDFLAAELELLAGVEQAIGRTELESKHLANSHLNRLLRNNQSLQRAGDVFMVASQNWFINEFDDLTVAVSHGSPWNYDTWVPLVFAGFGLEARRVARDVETVDVAATLSNVLQIALPSGNSGSALTEVAEQLR